MTTRQPAHTRNQPPTHPAAGTSTSTLTSTSTGPSRSTVLAGVVLLAAVAAGVVVLSPLDLGSRTDPSTHSGPAPVAATSSRSPMVSARHDSAAPRSLPTAAADEGVVGAEGNLLDDRSPTVVNLDPALRDALRTAATAALEDGIELRVNSGWRSAAEQQRLLDRAIAEYGSEKQARRWVATPETSAHVSGDAVDLGPSQAAAWLARHGAAYGLCPIYRNEPWHFELRQGAALGGCPARYADPTQDPRMSR